MLIKGAKDITVGIVDNPTLIQWNVKINCILVSVMTDTHANAEDQI